MREFVVINIAVTTISTTNSIVYGRTHRSLQMYYVSMCPGPVKFADWWTRKRGTSRSLRNSHKRSIDPYLDINRLTLFSYIVIVAADYLGRNKSYETYSKYILTISYGFQFIIYLLWADIILMFNCAIQMLFPLLLSQLLRN